MRQVCVKCASSVLQVWGLVRLSMNERGLVKFDEVEGRFHQYLTFEHPPYHSAFSSLELLP